MASDGMSSSLGGGRQTASPETQRLSELRIVLLGRSGLTGKSSSGNTILGREAFQTGVTKQSEKSQGDVAGRQPPGWKWSDSVQESPECVKQEIVRSVSLCPPGPHALLLLIPVWSYSFTERYRRSAQEHLELLSETVWRHTIVLFTWGDRLGDTTIEQHIERGGEELQRLVEKCGNRHHVLNNSNRGDGTQVTELLDKIDEMVAGHRGWHFTTERDLELEESFRQREEEEEETQSDEEREREREIREKEMKIEIDQLKKEQKEWEREIENLKQRDKEMEREIAELTHQLEEREREGEEEQRKADERRREIEEQLKKMDREREERERERREAEERHRREMEELRRCYERQARDEAERRLDSVRQGASAAAVALGAAVGATVGATAGALIGPRAAAAGSAIGAVVGGARAAGRRRHSKNHPPNFSGAEDPALEEP